MDKNSSSQMDLNKLTKLTLLSQIDLNEVSKLALLNDLSKDEFEKVIDLSVIEKWTSNKTIVEEGDKTTEVYLILDGEMLVSKWDEEHCAQVIIIKLIKGEMFGEMSFIDGSPRSTMVKTSKPTMLLKISKDSLASYPNILNKIISNMAIANIARLRSSNTQLVKKITENQYLTKFIQTVGKLLIYQYLIFGMVSLISHYFFKEKALYFSWLLALPITILQVKNVHYEWAHFGINLRHWRSSLYCSLATALLVLALLFILSKTPFVADLFEDWSFWGNVASPSFWAFFAIYSFSQEFIARGVFQTSMQDFLKDNEGYKSIFLNAAFLFVLSFPMGIVNAISIFLISLPLGFFFLKQKTLLGNILIHFLLLGFGILRY